MFKLSYLTGVALLSVGLVAQAQNVGVNTDGSKPDTDVLFHLKNHRVGSTALMRIQNSVAGNSGVEIRNSNSGITWQIINPAGSNELSISQNGTNRMTIQNDGTVRFAGDIRVNGNIIGESRTSGNPFTMKTLDSYAMFGTGNMSDGHYNLASNGIHTWLSAGVNGGTPGNVVIRPGGNSTNGQLTVAEGQATFTGNLTTDGVFLSRGAGTFGGDLTVNRNITVLGTGSFRSNLTVTRDLTVGRNATITGNLTFGSATTTAANGLRMVQRDYGTIFHQNGSDFYILKTNRRNPYGGYNGLRPFRIQNSTGNLYMGNYGLTVIHSNRRVGINNTNPSAGLDVNSTTMLRQRTDVYGGLHVRNDWVRVYGNGGIYFQNRGGGWYMSDNTWIRAYGNKSIITGGRVQANGGLYVGESRIDGREEKTITVESPRQNDYIAVFRTDRPIKIEEINGFLSTTGDMRVLVYYDSDHNMHGARHTGRWHRLTNTNSTRIHCPRDWYIPADRWVFVRFYYINNNYMRNKRVTINFKYRRL
jgi:cytoskeletal protein CcmA (bactofilin family)